MQFYMFFVVKLHVFYCKVPYMHIDFNPNILKTEILSEHAGVSKRNYSYRDRNCLCCLSVSHLISFNLGETGKSFAVT